jgi:hypothetical protein
MAPCVLGGLQAIPRRMFEDAASKELAESIWTQGVSIAVAGTTTFH